jgi:hypothetical protein
MVAKLVVLLDNRSVVKSVAVWDLKKDTQMARKKVCQTADYLVVMTVEMMDRKKAEMMVVLKEALMVYWMVFVKVALTVGK